MKKFMMKKDNQKFIKIILNLNLMKKMKNILMEKKILKKTTIMEKI